MSAAVHAGGSLVVSWDGYDDSQLSSIGSSVVGYEVGWRWFEGGVEKTASAGDISPLARSYTVQGLAPGRSYEVRVRARSSTHSGHWSAYTDEPAVIVPAGPAHREMTVTDATASEGDAAAAFTLEASLPESLKGLADEVAPLSVRWATAAGTAAAGSDYRTASGAVRIPADGSRATVTVPLIDDAVAEGDETFTIRLSDPTGAILVDASASATITDDDDGTVPVVPSSVAVCGDLVLTGRVSDVFDVTQPGFAGGHHVFVDADVTCPDAGSPVGLPVGVEVVGGPQASLGSSGHCLVQVGSRAVVVSAAAAAGCESFAVQRAVGGRSTHLVRVPDASVGRAHQLLVWIDADRDRSHDRGEPYQYVAADFVGRSVGGATLIDFGLADEFDVELVADGSDRVGRGGQDSELRLRLHATARSSRSQGEPVGSSRPLANALVGVAVSAGPSQGAEVVCLSPGGSASQCRTDADGQITVRYRVRSAAASVLRRTQDVLAVFHDPDQDGRRAFGAPTSFLARPVAKTVSYVALGDSYSSGENGRPEAAGFAGSYQSGVSPADGQCRRWSLAYPDVFARDVLADADPNIDVAFATFACTGATTRNVFDARDPDGASTVEAHHLTDRPSPAAALDEPVYGRESPRGPRIVVHPRDPQWEPRQAVSLAGVQATGDVDMITITIGGNDAGFGDVLTACVRSSCRVINQSGYGAIGDRVAAVAAKLRQTAPSAVIFVLGYPHITPEPHPCPRGAESCAELGLNSYIDRCRALSANRIVAETVDRDLVPDAASLFGKILFRTDAELGADLLGVLVAAAFDDRIRIDHVEAAALWQAASALNGELRDAAREAGVHFVDAAGQRTADPSARGFLGHSPCDAEPWLSGYLVDASRFPASSDGSFHPTEAGHVGYALLLEQYIAGRTRAGDSLTEAGLPVNPTPASQ